MEGFALPEYVVPRTGYDPSTPGGTIPKASNEVGSLFAKPKKAVSGPGPQHYHQDFLTKPFGGKLSSKFSKLDRNWVQDPGKSPAVGQYESFSDLTSPRTRGGKMPKSDRGCLFYDQAVSDSKWKPAPGKYNANKVEKHLTSPTFHEPTGTPRVAKKANQLGPGYYSPNWEPMEKRPPSFSGSKEEWRSAKAPKDKTPAPGHNGIPESKLEDRSGRQKHCRKLLGDIVVTPRKPRAPATPRMGGTPRTVGTPRKATPATPLPTPSMGQTF